VTEAAQVGPEVTAAQRGALGCLIRSLADNKATLGRRYGEWAVSAPTLESAVAAAAMAQDELGHARATYPLLKQLGLEVRDDQERLEPAGCMPVLASELPSWAHFVAVNLVIDGMLTGFVRSVADSAFAQLAQRARKILQEEGSHARHACGWARRLARDGRQQEAFAVTLGWCWKDASRWAGPADDRAWTSLARDGMVAAGPATMRVGLREQVAEALAGTGLHPALEEPVDWSDWSPEVRR
jgi:1,2-phenylacetyl-CoA epoxidase catalytic subunit